MKILFTADVHIKIGQKDVPKEWALNRFNMLWEQLAEAAESVEAVFVGGDIFDKIPNMEELECYFDFVASCTKPTFIYTGNHEMVTKQKTFLSYLAKATTRLNNKVEIIENVEREFLGLIDIIPYNHIKTFDPETFTAPILMTHVRGEIPPHVKPEIDLDKLDRWSVVLAGDLHSYGNSQRNILYPGSPVTTSFHRDTVTTGCIIFDCDTLTHVFHEFNLPQLLKKTVKAGDQTPASEFHHTMYEVEGSLNELATLSDNALVAKKVTKRVSDTALILDPKLSMAEEAIEYMRYILELNDEVIEEAVGKIYDYETRLTN